MRRRIADGTEAGVNLLRVWGGGLFESDDFYDVCDETGVLVWQDFLFACAAYSEEEPLRGEIVAEITEAVTRLSPHPSLVVWNGNNENLWGYEDWAWRLELGDLTWGRGYYLEVFPALMAGWTRRGRTRRGAPGRSTSGGARTTRTTAPATSGTSGTASTTRPTGALPRGSWPSSGTRDRRPGRH